MGRKPTDYTDKLAEVKQLGVLVAQYDKELAEAVTATSIRNILRAEVVQCLEVNGQIEVQLRVSGHPLWARISPWARDDLAIAPGQQVFAQIKSVSIAA